jgi:hypothetical protein
MKWLEQKLHHSEANECRPGTATFLVREGLISGEPPGSPWQGGSLKLDVAAYELKSGSISLANNSTLGTDSEWEYR